MEAVVLSRDLLGQHMEAQGRFVLIFGLLLHSSATPEIPHKAQ